MCSEIPWTSWTTARGGAEGVHSTAWTVWRPSLEGKEKDWKFVMELSLLLW